MQGSLSGRLTLTRLELEATHEEHTRTYGSPQTMLVAPTSPHLRRLQSPNGLLCRDVSFRFRWREGAAHHTKLPVVVRQRLRVRRPRRQQNKMVEARCLALHTIVRSCCRVMPDTFSDPDEHYSVRHRQLWKTLHYKGHNRMQLTSASEMSWKQSDIIPTQVQVDAMYGKQRSPSSQREMAAVF